MKVIAIKSGGKMALRILGAPFGGPFNGRDHDGDYFDSETKIHEDFYSEIPLIYSHGFDPKTGNQADVPVIVGRAKYSGKDEQGHWYEAVLDESIEVAKKLWESALQGLVKASSGAINYLVRRAKDGRLIEWGVAELSLVDTSEGMNPSNPYAVALPMLKAHFEKAGIEFQEPEEAGEASVQITEPLTTETESTTMNEEEKKAAEEAAKKAAEEARKAGPSDELDLMLQEMKAARERKEKENAAKAERTKKIQELVEETMKAAPAENGGAKAPSFLKHGRGDDEKKAFMHYLKTGDKKALVIMNESDDESGGAVVPTDIYNKIVELRDPLSVVRRMGAEVITTSRLTMNIPTEAIRLTAPADTAESAAATATSRTINQVEPLDTVAVTVDNYTFLLRVSEENINDSAFNLETWIASRVAKNYGVVENSALKTALYADVSNTLDAAGDLEVIAGDIFNTYYDLGEQYADNAVWVMKRSTEGAIRQLTGSPFAFGATPQGTSDSAGQRTLLYNPVFNLADFDAIAASKKIVFFGDPSYVKLVQNGTMTIRRLNERYADTGEVGFVCSQRFAIKVIGGAETWTYLLTLAS